MMERLLTSLLLVVLLQTGIIPALASPTALPVFPGAAGFGTQTPAGRGGAIIRVTNLNNHGAGSLRDALQMQGARIVVFEVSGTIRLNADIQVLHPFVTIAGQTSPPPGITLRGAGLSIKTHDVLVQHLRIRVGDEPDGPYPSSRDALRILGPSAFNVVVDHVSASWAIDENISTWFEVHDITISNSIISEGLYRSLNKRGPHSKGLLIGDKASRVAVYRNLFAKNVDRSPLVKGGGTVAVVNNLMYDSGSKKFIDMVNVDDAGPIMVAAVGNVLIRGKDTPAGAAAVRVHKSVKPGSFIYLLDNEYDGRLLIYGTAFMPRTFDYPVQLLKSTPIVASQQVEELVLAQAGARPAERDPVDARIIAEVRSRSGRIIDSQREVGGWPPQTYNYRKLALPPNPNGDDDQDGYTNIEEVLHYLAALVEGKEAISPVGHGAKKQNSVTNSKK
jgi:hypothetical protein